MALLVSIFVLVASAAPIAPEAPTYCEGFVANPQPRSIFVEAELRNGLTFKALRYASESWCEKPDDPERQKQAAGWRQRMVDELGLTPEQTIDSLRIRRDESGEHAIEKTCKSLLRGAEEDARLQADAEVLSTLLDCDTRFDTFKSPVETIANQSEQHDPVWLAGYAERCFRWLGRDRDSGRLQDRHAKNEAMCRFEASLVTPEAFEQALADDKRLGEAATIVARETFGRMKRSARLSEALWAEELEAPAMKAILVEAPAKAYAEWVARRQQNEAAWAAVMSVENEMLSTSKPGANCRKTLGAVAAKIFAHSSVDQNEWPTYWRADPLKVRFADALKDCEVASHPNAERGLIFAKPQFVAPVGPFRAAEEAMVAKARATVVERPKFALTKWGFMPADDDARENRADERRMHFDSTDEAAIASMKPQGANVLITFKQTGWTEYTLDCVETNKVDGIDPYTGRVIYRRNCKNGPSIQHTSRASPVLAPKEYTTGLKVGQFLVFTHSYDDPKLAVSFPIVSFESEKKKKVLTVFGQSLN